MINMNLENKKCKFCGSKNLEPLLDLGHTPIANSLLSNKYENISIYSLILFQCKKCLITHSIHNIDKKIIFKPDYVYLSSYSKLFLEHASKYVKDVIKKFSLKKGDFVIEVASNDGYLLKNFLNTRIKILGIEPTNLAAEKSKMLGIPTFNDFLNYENSKKIKKKNGKANLIIANNVIAHVPNLKEFVKSIINLVKKNGFITIEFPKVSNLFLKSHWDVIYHEHYSYFSLNTINTLFSYSNFRVFDHENLDVHGGSYRAYICHKNNHLLKTNKETEKQIINDRKLDLNCKNYFLGLSSSIHKEKYKLLKILISYKLKNLKVIGYTAPAKASTLLNFYGIRSDLIECIVDNNPLKIGKIIPGTDIKIISKKDAAIIKPDCIILFAWNVQKEIIKEIKSNFNNEFKILKCIPKISYLK